MSFNIAPLIARHHAEVNLGVNMHFLRQMPEGVNFDAFCKAVWAVLDGTTQSMSEKIDALMDIVHQNAHLLSNELISRWLRDSRDEVLGEIVWNSFQAMEPAYDLSKQIEFGSPEAWTIKQMLAVLKALAPDQTKAFAALAPDQTKAFAALALEKYPNIYGYDSKNDCLAGLAKHLWYAADDAVPQRFINHIESLRREVVSVAKKQPASLQEKPIKGDAVSRVIQLAAATEKEREDRQVKKTNGGKKKAGAESASNLNSPFSVLAGLRDEFPPARQNGTNGATHA